MISPSLLVLITGLYLALLFYIAYRGDQEPAGQFSRYQPLIFTFSLTVYCSSWTFFGAVGNAAQYGWGFFSIYLGPILVFVFFYPFLQKLITVSKRQKTTTIADFIATRYGKSQTLAAIVTVIALIGTVPYISLQLKAVASAYDMLSGRDLFISSRFVFADTAFYLGIILAIFSMLFGTRQIDATEHHRGMINAISFESIVKLLSLLAIAGLAYQILHLDTWATRGYQGTIDAVFEPFHMDQITPAFFTQLLLAACAIFCLPRQFHVAAVESRGDEMPVARWGFPIYLLLVSASVVPITAAGLMIFGTAENADLFMLSLPAYSDNASLATIAFLGGFSAATGMVIVATVALSTMVSNDLILPALLRIKKDHERHDFYPTLLQVRRITIFVVLALAYGYYRIALVDKSLFSIGLLSFASAIQFAPAIIGGLYWRRGHRNGAIIGLLAGFGVWLYTLMLPTLANSGWLPNQFVSMGLFGIDAFKPQELFGIPFQDKLTHGVVWSLGANILCYVFFSLRSRPSLTDRFQAADYLEGAQARSRYITAASPNFKVNDLMELCNRFVGQERTQRLILEIDSDSDYRNAEFADQELLKKAEQVLASSIGSATAERILNGALKASDNPEQNLVELLGQTSQALQFNREILQVTLDNISQGVSVVDGDLNLVAWNKPYINLFRYPEGFIKVGMPAEDIIRYNIRRGLGMLKENSEEAEIKKRLDYLSGGASYSYERIWRDGTVIQTQGTRLPDGGYVTSYTNITPLKRVQHELERINETLEAKVEQRTETLSRLNKKLEEATVSKTRFLAAASHDLAQPLSAGKLYLGALLQDLEQDRDKFRLADNALAALQSAESLLKALLDVSKLDSGVITPSVEAFPIRKLLNGLENEFSIMAEEKGLGFRIVSSDKWVLSDENLLHSILQNFLSNAIRYTPEGSVMMLCRPDECGMRIEVRDSGIGIDSAYLEDVFQEFHQLHENATEGLGLGLAITRRIANLLSHQVGVRSRVGSGSVFFVRLPIVSVEHREQVDLSVDAADARFLNGASILCMDDEPAILEATKALLERWGAQVTTVKRVKEFDQLCQAKTRFDVFIADYHLRDERMGLDLLKAYRDQADGDFLGILMTAERDPTIEDQALMEGFDFIEKPVEPNRLREALIAYQSEVRTSNKPDVLIVAE